jgi:hypothetical protein
MNLTTLHCQLGDHVWQRRSQRGRPPLSCPNCQSPSTAVTDILISAAAKASPTAVIAKAESSANKGSAPSIPNERWTMLQSVAGADSAQLQTDIDRWSAEYAELLASCLTADLSIFDRLDRLQRAIINGLNRQRAVAAEQSRDVGQVAVTATLS